MNTKKRALISVSDKSGVIEFAAHLKNLNYEIVSTGGTYEALKNAGIEVTYISEVTHFPEIMDGRVKTLHPAIHGGILGKRSNDSHMAALKEQKITPIDLVAVNLYPFKEVASKESVSWEELIENIDIGGPSMVRSAAKNHEDVLIIVDPTDYSGIISMLEKGEVPQEKRIALAIKAFRHTAEYDGFIQEVLQKRSTVLKEVHFTEMEKVADLRYGENPGQQAALYRDISIEKGSLLEAKQLQGKELSYNNWLDTDSAFRLIVEFNEPAAVIIKHTNPCGVAIGKDIEEAFEKAHKSDEVSAFGGIIALNQAVDLPLAKELVKTFWEVILAPAYTKKALEVLEEKKNLRLLELEAKHWQPIVGNDCRSISGGWLIQEKDLQESPQSSWKVVSQKSPEESQLSDYEFGWKVVKHIKSNAIVLVKDGVTIGVGAGQMNRVGSAKIAIEQAGEKTKGSILASDAFFPFGDTVEMAAKAGVIGVIQPGGSIRDQESTDEADKHQMVMIHTGVRHFKH